MLFLLVGFFDRGQLVNQPVNRDIVCDKNGNLWRNDRTWTSDLSFCSKLTTEFSGVIYFYENGHFDHIWPHVWSGMAIYKVIMKHEHPTYHSVWNWPLNPVVLLVFTKLVILTTFDHTHGQEWSKNGKTSYQNRTFG